MRNQRQQLKQHRIGGASSLHLSRYRDSGNRQALPLPQPFVAEEKNVLFLPS